MIHLHLSIKLTDPCDNTLFVASLTQCFCFVRPRDPSETPLLARWASRPKVSEVSLGRDETKVLRTTSHEQRIITSNCQLHCQFSLVNLCGQESLCDIRRDCCLHFVSERDFGCDAQRVCRAKRSLNSTLAGTKRKRYLRLATNNILPPLFI